MKCENVGNQIALDEIEIWKRILQFIFAFRLIFTVHFSIFQEIAAKLVWYIHLILNLISVLGFYEIPQKLFGIISITNNNSKN